MADRPSRQLAVILHADVVGSTALVQVDESLAHERIQEAFQRLLETTSAYGGTARMRSEHYEQEKAEDEVRWQSYLDTGAHVTHKEMTEWLSELADHAARRAEA